MAKDGYQISTDPEQTDRLDALRVAMGCSRSAVIRTALEDLGRGGSGALDRLERQHRERLSRLHTITPAKFATTQAWLRHRLHGENAFVTLEDLEREWAASAEGKRALRERAKRASEMNQADREVA